MVPSDSEPRVHKSFNPAFEDTSLDDALAQVGATRIVLADATTNWCTRATAYGALDRGYDLTLIRDGHTTGAMDLGVGVAVDAESVVNDLNAVMTWVTYPGRSSSTAAAEDLDL